MYWSQFTIGTPKTVSSKLLTNKELEMYQFVVVAASFFFLTAGLSAQQRERTTIPEKYKWDLTQIYRSHEAWRTAKDHLEKEIPTVRTFKGTLGTSPANLADALARLTAMRKSMAKLATYGNLQSDEDTRVAEHRGMRQEMTLVDAAR
jgi:oligoendopeptidase F